MDHQGLSEDHHLIISDLQGSSWSYHGYQGVIGDLQGSLWSYHGYRGVIMDIMESSGSSGIII